MSSFLNVQRKKLDDAAREQESRRTGWSGNQVANGAAENPAQIASQKAAPPRIGRIVNGTPTNDYKAVGKVGDSQFGYGCSGTLIGSRYVLTAAHCAEGVGNTEGKFQINGQNYKTSKVIVHPNYNTNTLANDIAIFELDRDVQGVTPVDIYRGTPRVGQELTLVGFGAGGTGTSGHNGDYGTKRVGTTDIDGVSGREITWKFDDNTESNTAPGDSGGAAFVTVGGQLYLAGVTSGGSTDDAGIGDESYDTRVDAFKSWINANTDGGGDPGPGPGPGGNKDDHANSLDSSATAMDLNNRNVGRGKGKLETKSDRDVFQFTVDQSGSAIINAKGKGGLDTHLEIYDANRKLVSSNDNRIGSTKDSQVRVNLNKGTYYAAVESSGGSSTGNYSVVVKHRPGSSGAGGDDHGNRIGQASEIKLNAAGNMNVRARIGKGNDKDVFKVTANKSGTMRFQTSGTTGNLDTKLTVYDQNGRRLKSNDDFGAGLDSRVNLRVQSGKSYYVQVSSYDTTKGSYRLTSSIGRNRSGANALAKEPTSETPPVCEASRTGGLAALRNDSLTGIDLSQDRLNSFDRNLSHNLNSIRHPNDAFSTDAGTMTRNSMSVCDMKLSQMKELFAERPDPLSSGSTTSDMLKPTNSSISFLASI